jgi:O-antigen/teichoic acid export membrane protein
MNRRSTIAFAISPIIVSAIGFVLIPTLSWWLHEDDMAKFVIFLTNTNFFVLLVSLGLDQALAREFHEARSPKKLIKNVLQLVLLAIPIGILGLGAIKASTNGLSSDAITAPMVISCILLLLNRIYSTYIRMSGKGIAYAIDIVTPKALQLSAIVMIGSQSVHLLSYDFVVKIFISSAALMLCYEVFMTNRIARSLELCDERSKLKNQPHYADLLKFGVPLVPGALAYYAISASAIYIVAAHGNYREVVTVSLAISLGGGLAVLQSVFATLWTPFAYRWQSKNKSPALYGHIATILTTACSVLLLASMIFVPLLSKIFPEKYGGISGLVILVIAWNLLYLISIVGSFGVGVMRMSMISMIISIVGASISIVTSIVANEHLGAHGVLIAVLCAFNITLILNCEFSAHRWHRVVAWKHYIMVGVMTISGVMFSFKYEWQAQLMLIISIAFYIPSFRSGSTKAHELIKQSGIQ